ncbi:cbb3-type cytochrome oxidase subunit 3 [Neptunicella sp. SCSIO 80796]|uniref:cbb3-type cytochrome oxidase subunit 3 n=1 Tax=Neptunicella plasticusilytica TaxID=3117012 RepID=UPI003A4E1CC6
MDHAFTNTIYTVLVFVIFIGIVLWAYSSKSKKSFDEAANLIFDDEKNEQKTEQKNRESSKHE